MRGTESYPPGANGSTGRASEANGSLGQLPMAQAPMHHGPVAAAVQPKGEQNSLDVKGLWNAFRRRWFLATSVGVVLGACAAVPAYLLTPAPYESFAEFHISSIDDHVLSGTPAPPRPPYPTWKQTQMKLVKSPYVLTGALRNLDVSHSPILADQPREMDWLEENLIVEQSGAEFFRIGLAGEHPAELAKIVNAVCESYKQEIILREEKLWLDSVDELKQASRVLKDNIKSRYHRLETYPSTTPDSAGVDALVRVDMSRQIAKLHMDIMDAELLQARMTATKPQGDAAAGKELPELPGEEFSLPKEALEQHMASISPEYAELYDKLPGLEWLAKRSREVRTKNHPRRVEAEEDLAETKQQLELLEKDLLPQVMEALRQSDVEVLPTSADELAKRIAAMKSEQTRLEEALKALDANVRDADMYAVEIDEVNAEIDSLESVHSQLLSAITRLEMAEARRNESEDGKWSPTGTNLIQKAEVPIVRSMKKKITMAGGAGFGMMGLFIAGVVLLEYRARRVSTVDEVSGGLNLRVMGVVPQIPRNLAAGKSAKSQAKNAYWSSVLTESIDSTRTQLLRDASLEPLQCLMVASAMSGEGKTTLCCHLATSLARAGRKVILIDCDARRPSIHRVFNLPSSVGVCEVLRGEISLDEAVVELESPGNLSIIPAGAFDHQIPQLLAQGHLGEILEPLKKQFDFVIIDSSPILPVTDSLLVAQHADAAILAVRRDISRLPKVHAARHRLAMLGVPILGAVAIGLHEDVYDYRPGRGYAYGYQPAGRASYAAIEHQSAEV